MDTSRDNFFARFVGLCSLMERAPMIQETGRFPCTSEPGVPETDSNCGIKTVQRFLKTFHSFQRPAALKSFSGSLRCKACKMGFLRNSCQHFTTG